jgi:tRNA threonylcarbamoyladenosine modification (KEOPS) complex  Pcc1 subunit
VVAVAAADDAPPGPGGDEAVAPVAAVAAAAVSRGLCAHGHLLGGAAFRFTMPQQQKNRSVLPDRQRNEEARMRIALETASKICTLEHPAKKMSSFRRNNKKGILDSSFRWNGKKEI